MLLVLAIDLVKVGVAEDMGMYFLFQPPNLSR